MSDFKNKHLSNSAGNLGRSQPLRLGSHDESRILWDALRYAQRTCDLHERERIRLESQLSQITQDNMRYGELFIRLEQLNQKLTSLVVASRRLLGTLDHREVIKAIKEIILDLVGSEEIALFEVDTARSQLRLMDSNGIQSEAYYNWPLTRGLLGSAACSGELIITDGDSTRAKGEENLSAVVPLKLDGWVAWLIAIFRLFPQKGSLEAVDKEIFELLSSHGSIALYVAEGRTRLLVPNDPACIHWPCQRFAHEDREKISEIESWRRG